MSGTPRKNSLIKMHIKYSGPNKKDGTNENQYMEVRHWLLALGDTEQHQETLLIFTVCASDWVAGFNALGKQNSKDITVPKLPWS